MAKHSDATLRYIVEELLSRAYTNTEILRLLQDEQGCSYEEALRIVRSVYNGWRNNKPKP